MEYSGSARASCESDNMAKSRRSFVKGMVSASALAGVAGVPSQIKAEEAKSTQIQEISRPNVVLYVADQMRWDFVAAHCLNPTARTPNLDKIARRGVDFTGAVTNQPLCSPSRACMMTGRYATETGMWKLPPPTQLDRSLPTLATEFRKNGYTANFIGKWHLAPGGDARPGFVAPEYRGGFLDFWEGASVLEWTSHPYEGTIWDAHGTPISFKDQYRVDFITDRAVRFLRQPQEKPFLLFISQLEPHYQDDELKFVAPKGYAERYQNPFVPADLLHQSGDWQAQLPDYYGCIEKIDESVGTILQTLEEQHQLDNTIFLFTSDHGCHFRTRNEEYKRSPHDSSIRVPFIAQGPGLNYSQALPEIIGNINLTPTLLDSAGIAVPKSMKGVSLLPLLRDAQARSEWENKVLIQISESMVGRAIRTKEWTYCAADPSLDGKAVQSSNHYQEYQMYNNYSDPAQKVNLAGRQPFREAAEQLRAELLAMIVESGESEPTITPARLYP